MYRCESWTIKKAEHQRIDAFELWCWRKLLRVPWTVRRSNQSILKAICPGCSLEGLMLKLKLQYFVHLMRRADSFEKTLMLGKIEGGRREGWQRMRWLDGVTNSKDMVCCGSRDCKESDTTERMNWTELNWTLERISEKAIFSQGNTGLEYNFTWRHIRKFSRLSARNCRSQKGWNFEYNKKYKRSKRDKSLGDDIWWSLDFRCLVKTMDSTVELYLPFP